MPYFFDVRTDNLSINLAVPGFAIKYNHMYLAFTYFTLLFLKHYVLALTLNYFDSFYIVFYVHFKLNVVNFQKRLFDLSLKRTCHPHRNSVFENPFQQMTTFFS